MKSHPMGVNANTRVRWEVIKRLHVVEALCGARVLDAGCGLGFFSVQFADLGAEVTAIDVDKNSLMYLSDNYGINTQYMNIEKDNFSEGAFDLIFLGEILEHMGDPIELLEKAKRALAPSGHLLITTPALEGWLIHTRGKKLGHHDGSEKHERDGFYLKELNDLISRLGMKSILHKFSIYTGAELFMQLTKWMFLRKKTSYARQADVLKDMKRVQYRMLKAFYPVLLVIFMVEQAICDLLRMKGHCHIIVAQRS